MPEFAEEEYVEVPRAPWWDDNEGVTVRRYILWGDENATKNAMFAVKGTAQEVKEEVNMKAEIASMEEVLLDRMIQSWTLRNKKGEILPLHITTIRRLSPRTAKWILAFIDSNNPEKTEEERDSFLQTFRDGSKGGKKLHALPST